MNWNGTFNSDDNYIYYCGQESLRRNGVNIIVNKRVRNAVLGCNLKNDRIISACFQGKAFDITVIQVYAPSINAEEAEIEQFDEDLQDFLELTPKKKRRRRRCPFHCRGLECKSRSQEITGVSGKIGLGVQNEAGQRLTQFFQEHTGHRGGKPLLPS